MEITTVGGAIALVVIIIALFCYYKFCVPKSDDKDEAASFLTGFQSVFESIIEDIIDDIDLSSYSTVEELESDIFAIAYNRCWEYTEASIETACENNSITKLIAKCITKENVEALVTQIINTSFTSKVEAKYVTAWNKTTEEITEEDTRLQNEADLYETGAKEVPEYEEKVEEITEEINPPREDGEEPYNANDTSQEIVEETEEVSEGVDLTEAINDANSGEGEDEVHE